MDEFYTNYLASLFHVDSIQPWFLGFPVLILLCVVLLRQLVTRRNEPPLVPYRIPLLGHGLAFMKDNYGFIDSIRYSISKRNLGTFELIWSGSDFRMRRS